MIEWERLGTNLELDRLTYRELKMAARKKKAKVKKKAKKTKRATKKVQTRTKAKKATKKKATRGAVRRTKSKVTKVVKKKSKRKTTTRKTKTKTAARAVKVGQIDALSSKKIVAYQVVEEKSLRQLEDEVNYRISKGWEPVGGMSLLPGTGTMLQTLVMTEDA